jgi:hypothetical protein
LPPCPFWPILCNAILSNAVHLGDCYRDFPLCPAWHKISTEESRSQETWEVWPVSVSTFYSWKRKFLEKEIPALNRNLPALHTEERAQLTLLLNYWSIHRANLIVNLRDFATRVAGLGCDTNTRVYAAGQKPPAKSCVRPLVGLDVRCPWGELEVGRTRCSWGLSFMVPTVVLPPVPPVCEMYVLCFVCAYYVNWNFMKHRLACSLVLVYKYICTRSCGPKKINGNQNSWTTSRTLSQ